MKTSKLKILILALIVFCLPVIPVLNSSAAEMSVVDEATGAAVTEFKTHTLTSGSDADYEKLTSYYVTLPSDTLEAVVPIKLTSKGYLDYDLGIYENENLAGYDFGFYSDKDCTKKLTFSPPTAEYMGTVKIPKAGTYYVKFTATLNEGAVDTIGIRSNFRCQFYSGADKTLKDNTSVVSAIVDSKPIYYKITAPKAGSIEFVSQSVYSSKITLLDSKKKAISSQVSSTSTNGYITDFAVEKGTYYIKVSSTSEVIAVKYKFKAITDSSGSSKAKAKKLTLGKNAAGMLSATKSTDDWYKFTLTKDTYNFKLMVSPFCSSGSIKFTLYAPNGKVMNTKSLTNRTYTLSPITYISKGTYYVKISKSTAKTSGSYTLNVKQ